MRLDDKAKKIIVLLIIIPLGISVFGDIIAGWWLESQKMPKINIDNIKFDDEFLKFRVSNSGEATADSVHFQLIRLNQTQNTCDKNLTFFNSSWNPMCNFIMVDSGIEHMCQVNVPPSASGKYYNIEWHVSWGGLDREKIFENVSNCELEEIIQIYGTDGNIEEYSRPTSVTIRSN